MSHRHLHFQCLAQNSWPFPVPPGDAALTAQTEQGGGKDRLLVCQPSPKVTFVSTRLSLQLQAARCCLGVSLPSSCCSGRGQRRVELPAAASKMHVRQRSSFRLLSNPGKQPLPPLTQERPCYNLSPVGEGGREEGRGAQAGCLYPDVCNVGLGPS